MEALLILLILIAQIGLIVVLITIGYFLFNGVFGVPWVRTRASLTDEMLRLAELQPGEKVVDFGSGDGAMVIQAARDHGAYGYGIERLRLLVWLSRYLARRYGVEDRTEFVHGDMFKEKPPQADVVMSYLFKEVNERLEPILLEHYPSGTRVVARTFSFPGLKHVTSKTIQSETIHLYETP